MLVNISNEVRTKLRSSLFDVEEWLMISLPPAIPLLGKKNFSNAEYFANPDWSHREPGNLGSILWIHLFLTPNIYCKKFVMWSLKLTYVFRSSLITAMSKVLEVVWRKHLKLNIWSRDEVHNFDQWASHSIKNKNIKILVNYRTKHCFRSRWKLHKSQW